MPKSPAFSIREICFEEGLTLETSALECLHDGQLNYVTNSVDKTKESLPLPYLRSTTVSLETNPLKVPLGRKFHFPPFCIFVYNMTFLLTLPNFNPLRRLELLFFFSFLFEISRPPLLGLVPEVKAQITGSDVIGSTRKIPQGQVMAAVKSRIKS